MSHPLINDLTKLTDEELNTKYADLTKKLTMSHRFGNGEMISQLQMVIGDFRYEIQRRSAKALEELMGKTAEFKNIIDIN